MGCRPATASPPPWPRPGRTTPSPAPRWRCGNGNIDDLGPQVIAATAVGSNQLSVKVGFDAAHSLAALDATAGVRRGLDRHRQRRRQAEATAATLTGADTLLLTFGAPLPAGSTLYYGHGYGRLEAADGTGRGHAVYDDDGHAGLGRRRRASRSAAPRRPRPAAAPVVAPCRRRRRAVPPRPPAPAPPCRRPGSAASPMAGTMPRRSGPAPSTTASRPTRPSAVEGAPGATCGGVQFTPASWDPSWSTHLAFDNLPDAALDLHAAGGLPLDVLLVSARGGAVILGEAAATASPGSRIPTPPAPAMCCGSRPMAAATPSMLTAVGLSGLADYDRWATAAATTRATMATIRLAEVHLGSGAGPGHHGGRGEAA